MNHRVGKRDEYVSDDDMNMELTWHNVYRDETQRDEIKRRVVVLEHVVEMMMMMTIL
jgi:hypothetical protein